MNSLSVLEINYAAVSFVMVCHVWAQTIREERANMSCHFHLYFFSFFDNNLSHGHVLLPENSRSKITERAPKTISTTKLPHPLVQAASFTTFHQLAVYMGKPGACSILWRHLSKARWLMAN